MTRSMLIKLRRGTAAQWTAANPTLAAGEPGWESDTNKVKFGDGATAWNALAYFSGAGSSPLTTKGDVYGHSGVDARIPVGTDGQVLTADSTQTLGLKWASGVAGVAQLNVLDSGQFTGGTVSTSNSTDATAVTVCSTAGHTYDGSTNVIIMVHIPATDTAANASSGAIFTLWEDGTDLGRFAVTKCPAASVLRLPVDIVTPKRTPSAGAHTYTLKMFSSAVGLSVVAYGGAGGAGANAPATLYVVQTN